LAGREVSEDVERIVGIGEVGLARVLAGLKQLDVRCQVLAGLDGFGLPEYQVAVDHAIEGRLLAGILTVAQPFFDRVDGPGDFFVEQGLPLLPVHEADFHVRRKVVVHDGAVHFFQIVSHGVAP
jgi:hypothetical protein